MSHDNGSSFTFKPQNPLFGRFNPGDLKPGEGLPIDQSPAARQARAEAIRAAIARMRALQNGPEEDDRDFFRAMDEANPGRFNLEKYFDHGPDPA